MPQKQLPDFPPTADLCTEIFRPLPVVSDLPVEASKDWLAGVCGQVLSALHKSLETSSAKGLADVFVDDGAYWRDSLAFTYHLRTFSGRDAIAAALAELNPQRKSRDFEVVAGSAAVVAGGPSLGWIESRLTFSTGSPSSRCAGRMLLIPVRGDDGTRDWKIWVLCTWLVDFDDFLPDESRLKAPSIVPGLLRKERFRTDVLIVGAGNSGLVLASRLKTLGVNYVLVEKNKNIGDNWALRYDTLRFHTGNGFCETPYLPYLKHAHVGLHRDELADQMRRFASEFNLEEDVLHSTTVRSTAYDSERKVWTVTLSPSGKTIECKHMVLCTGIGSWAPDMPEIPGREAYKGVSIHSAEYKNGRELAGQGVKSVIVVGSANTAFDVSEDCYNAGIKTTMIQRSPTYVVPMSHLLHPNGFGMFDYLPLDIADPMMFAGPLAIGGQLLGLLHESLTSKEPDRYAELAKSGFQVNRVQTTLTSNLAERQGGHYVDMGTGVELLSTGKVGIRSGVTPAAFTTTGVRLSDGGALDADAVVWCTGFRDRDVRYVVEDILGEGAADIRDRMDGTWSLDAEGEYRGVWKRHKNVENFFVLGGGTGFQRWYSKLVALQIKADLEGILPDAYRT